MPPKPKDIAEKVAVLKGKDAEDRVLAYLKKMNRPFGAVDVCANLKGAVPKATTQKILMALAEKGEVTQKAYGKSTFFVAKQEQLEDMPAEKIKSLEAEQKLIEEEIKIIEADVKAAAAELSKIQRMPTDAELGSQIEQAESSVTKAMRHLEPLRAGTPLISPSELTQLDTDWMKWRAEWTARRKVFKSLWDLVTDSLPPQDSADLAEDLGIEVDSTEHTNIEQGPLCSLKRK
ncbi:TBPIP-domain-containing protein [Rickenella mellea]|uniref:TBPIP-domain-containing protein n=1 Tax=Rickenella mellea TaxID=50990 RepID=A0A4Y7QEI4_9AGAM|nr:TBPIP-domain-containing protein [Rickenella mellea]